MNFEASNISIINSTYSITYRRKPQIGDKLQNNLSRINSLVEDFYLPAELLPVPYTIEPEIPRAILNAINGHSQMIFSQIGANLNAQFDKRYQGNFGLCRNYLKERTEIMLEILKMVDVKTTYYMGLATTIQFRIDKDEEEIIQHIMSVLNKSITYFSPTRLQDINNKFTFILNDEYFANITIGNYRNYNMGGTPTSSPMTVSLAEATLLDKGIFIHLDLNNRHKYNVTGNEMTNIHETKEWLYSFTEEFVNKKVLNILREGVFDL